MRKPMKIAVGALAAIGLLALGAGVSLVGLSQRPVPVGLVDGRLRPCPPAPRCVCSEAPAGPASIPPLAFSGAPEAAFRSLVEFLEGERGVTLAEVRADYVHAVYRTPVLRFADDMELRLDPEAKVVHVRSESRVGHSDLGANRARVEDLRRRWSAEGED